MPAFAGGGFFSRQGSKRKAANHIRVSDGAAVSGDSFSLRVTYVNASGGQLVFNLNFSSSIRLGD